MQTSIIKEIEQNQIATLKALKIIPEFRPGDNVKVSVKIAEGASERIQIYEGLVIARRNAGINSSFLVRKVTNNEGTERRFLLYSPLVNKIEVVRRGDVRRAKLYYIRNRKGKSARIKEKMHYKKV
jgi:large subunit ribosomal protein L19